MTFLSSNIDLLPYNTFGVAVEAHFFASFSTIEELRNIVGECKDRALEWYVLGGGSNILFTGNFRGVLIHPLSDKITAQGNLIIAEAGVEWDYFVKWCTSNGYCGVENLAYIPGTVGASPVQNIGAYGAQVSDTIEWVEYLDTEDMTLKRVKNSDCSFGYRDSIFKGELKGRAIITCVAYRLNQNFTAQCAKLDYGDLRSRVESMEGGITLENIRQAVTAIRREKLPEPSEIGSAGSFFKNPVIPIEQFNSLQLVYSDIPSYTAEGGIKVPAGWLIDRAGFKGYREGAVGVHPRQALVLVNYGGGTADEILSLADKIITTVAEKYNITISMEVNVL